MYVYMYPYIYMYIYIHIYIYPYIYISIYGIHTWIRDGIYNLDDLEIDLKCDAAFHDLS